MAGVAREQAVWAGCKRHVARHLADKSDSADRPVPADRSGMAVRKCVGLERVLMRAAVAVRPASRLARPVCDALHALRPSQHRGSVAAGQPEAAPPFA